MALAAPAIADHPLGQHDQIARVLLAVNHEPAKAVVLQASHAMLVPAVGAGHSRTGPPTRLRCRLGPARRRSAQRPRRPADGAFNPNSPNEIFFDAPRTSA